jgi:hypothetical protein
MHLTLERGVPQKERHIVAVGGPSDRDVTPIQLEVVLCGPLGRNMIPLNTILSYRYRPQPQGVAHDLPPAKLATAKNSSGL